MNKTSKRSMEIILNAIGTEPKTRQEIVQLTGFTYGTVCRYINQFIDDGLIDSHLIIDNYSKPKICPVRQEKSKQIKQKILEAIQNGNDTCNKLIAETGFSSQTIYKYSKQLVDEGLIPKDALKKEIVYHKKKEGKQPEPKKIDLDLPKTILSKIKEKRTRKQIAEELHLGYGVVCRNIRRLVAEGLIKPEDIIDDDKGTKQYNIEQTQEKQERKQQIFEAIQEGNNTRVQLVAVTGIGYQSVCRYIKELIAEGGIKPSDIKNTYSHGKNKKTTVKDIRREEKAYSLIHDFAKRYRANKINLSDVLAISKIIESHPETISINTVMLVIRAFRKTHRVDLAEKFCDICLKALSKKENRLLYEQISSINKKLKNAKREVVIEHMITPELKRGDTDFYKIIASASTETTRKTARRNNTFAYDNLR